MNSSRVAAENQKVLLDLLGRTRDIAEQIGSFGGAAGEVRRNILRQTNSHLIQVFASFILPLKQSPLRSRRWLG